jgi:hypothetical protein
VNPNYTMYGRDQLSENGQSSIGQSKAQISPRKDWCAWSRVPTMAGRSAISMGLSRDGPESSASSGSERADEPLDENADAR